MSGEGEGAAPAYPHNYFKGFGADENSLRYRLEGDDVIKQVSNRLRGGLKRGRDGREYYDERQRLMNEVGIEATEFFLAGSVNKVNHLTRYRDEKRVMIQLRELSGAYLYELTLNMKLWGPLIEDEVQGEDAPFVDHGYLYSLSVPGTTRELRKYKVRNKYLILQVVENAMIQSMLRGKDGREAELTAPNILVNEEVNRASAPQRQGFFGMFRRGDVHG